MTVHILEGSTSGGGMVYVACAPGRPRFKESVQVVGRAWVLDGTRRHEVTCKRCLARYLSSPATVQSVTKGRQISGNTDGS